MFTSFIFLYYVDTTKDIVDHFFNYLSLEMDADLIAQQLNSLKLLNQDEFHVVMTGMSNYQKNCLVLEKIRNMDMDSLTAFCKLLESIPHHKHMGTMLLNGKNAVYRGGSRSWQGEGHKQAEL